jgi:CRP-like cAMP-binding protein
LTAPVRKASRGATMPPLNQSEEMLVLVDPAAQLYARAAHLHSVASLPAGLAEALNQANDEDGNMSLMMEEMSNASSDDKSLELERFRSESISEDHQLHLPSHLPSKLAGIGQKLLAQKGRSESFTGHNNRMVPHTAPGSRRASIDPSSITRLQKANSRRGSTISLSPGVVANSRRSSTISLGAVSEGGTKSRGSIRSQLRRGTAPSSNLSNARYSLQLQASMARAAEASGINPCASPRTSICSRSASIKSLAGMQYKIPVQIAAQKRASAAAAAMSDRRGSYVSVSSHNSISSFVSRRSRTGTGPLEGLPGFTDDEAATGLELWPLWKESVAELPKKIMLNAGRALAKTSGTVDSGNLSSMVRRMSTMSGRLSVYASTDSNIHRASACWNRMIVHPNSTLKIVWDIAGMSFMGDDLIAIPLSSFDIPPSTFQTLMAWMTLLFWTFDFPCSFITGYTLNGVIEVKHKKIATRYLKTWFPFDVMVLSIDWLLTIFEEIGKKGDVDSVGYVKMGRTARMVRLLRLLRLLRLVKVQGKLSEVLQAIQSEYIKIILGIVKLIIFIMLLNHVICCGWYLIGRSGPDDRNWVAANSMMERSIGYRYSTSLHWSLTQFTPASMEIVPQNTGERVYNVVVLIFAMVTFSSFISSITNATTLLRTLDAADTERRAYLFKYLRQHKISMLLASEVWSWVLMHKAKRQSVQEKDVAVLELLPKSLQTQLRDQVFGPSLTMHPLFKRIANQSSAGASKLYANCMNEVAVGMGKELFMTGEVADQMYFLVSGQMRYYLEDPDKVTEPEKDEKNEKGEKNKKDVKTEKGDKTDKNEIVPTSSSSSASNVGKRLTTSTHSGEMRQLTPGGTQRIFGSNAEKQSVRWMAATDGDGQLLQVGDWFCEPILWVKWKHRGTLDARNHSDLYGLSSKKFIEFVEREGNEFLQLCLYARHFMKYVAMCGEDLTDVWADTDNVTKITQDAYEEYSSYEQECLEVLREDLLREECEAAMAEIQSESFRQDYDSGHDSTASSAFGSQASKSVQLPGTLHDYSEPVVLNLNTLYSGSATAHHERPASSLSNPDLT